MMENNGSQQSRGSYSSHKKGTSQNPCIIFCYKSNSLYTYVRFEF